MGAGGIDVEGNLVFHVQAFDRPRKRKASPLVPKDTVGGEAPEEATADDTMQALAATVQEGLERIAAIGTGRDLRVVAMTNAAPGMRESAPAARYSICEQIVRVHDNAVFSLRVWWNKLNFAHCPAVPQCASTGGTILARSSRVLAVRNPQSAILPKQYGYGIPWTGTGTRYINPPWREYLKTSEVVYPGTWVEVVGSVLGLPGHEENKLQGMESDYLIALKRLQAHMLRHRTTPFDVKVPFKYYAGGPVPPGQHVNSCVSFYDDWMTSVMQVTLRDNDAQVGEGAVGAAYLSLKRYQWTSGDNSSLHAPAMAIPADALRTAKWADGWARECMTQQRLGYRTHGQRGGSQPWPADVYQSVSAMITGADRWMPLNLLRQDTRGEDAFTFDAGNLMWQDTDQMLGPCDFRTFGNMAWLYFLWAGLDLNNQSKFRKFKWTRMQPIDSNPVDIRVFVHRGPFRCNGRRGHGWRVEIFVGELV